jgi:hypothetical protein
MSNLNPHLQRLSELLVQLNNNPSALLRDKVLEDLRQFYDAVLSMPLSAAEPQAQPLRPRAVITMSEPTLQENASAVEESDESLTHAVSADTAPQATEPLIEATATAIPDGPVAAVEQPAPVRSRFMVSVSETPDAPTPLADKRAELIGSDHKAERPNDSAILAGRLNAKPITDLQSGIPLNEKFGLIRNLFAGNASDFGDAVLKLNNSRSAEELRHYFQLLSQRRNWDLESESYRVFQSFVERRASTLGPSDTDTDH